MYKGFKYITLQNKAIFDFSYSIRQYSGQNNRFKWVKTIVFSKIKPRKIKILTIPDFWVMSLIRVNKKREILWKTIWLYIHKFHHQEWTANFTQDIKTFIRLEDEMRAHAHIIR